MRSLTFTTAVTVALLGLVSLALAQSGQLEIPWFTVDGGGAVVSRGENFALSGTVGQPDANASSGLVFGLRGGFWEALTVSGPPAPAVYLPLVLKSYSP